MPQHACVGDKAYEVMTMSGGILRLPDGQSVSLRPVADPEWAEHQVRRSVQPKALWSLTTPLLPVGEDLTTSLGTVVPLLGLDGEGRAVALLFDLRVDRPITTVLGEALAILYWLEQLKVEQLETFGRYFWQEPNASLAAVWAQVHGRSERGIALGHAPQVHLLSWRPFAVLWQVQSFLQRYSLAIFFFALYTFQGQKGESVIIAEPVVVQPVGAAGVEPTPIHRVGEIDEFLRSLEASSS